MLKRMLHRATLWVLGSVVWACAGAADPVVILATERAAAAAEPDGGGSLYAVTVAPDGVAWIAGDRGRVLSSRDEGRTWTRSESGTQTRLFDVSFASAHEGWIVGAHGTVLRTTDGGRHWRAVSTGDPNNFHSVTAPGPGRVRIGGSDGLILSTDDGGESWADRSGTTDGIVRGLGTTDDGDTTWAVGDHGLLMSAAADGEWLPAELPDDIPTTLRGIRFEDDQRGVAWGDGGVVLQTLDGGSRWLRVAAPPVSVRGFVSHGSRLLAFGSGGLLRWLPETSPAEAVGDAPLERELSSLRAWARDADAGSLTANLVDGATSSEWLILVSNPGAIIRVDMASGDAGQPREGPAAFEVVLAPEGTGPRGERYAAELARFLGQPYRLNPLGEGFRGAVDADPRFSLSAFDCVTLMETALAFELAGDQFAPVLPLLDAIRYAGAEVSFDTRNHFFAVDWVQNNSWLVEDITASLVGADDLLTVERSIGRQKLYRDHGAPTTGVTDELRTIHVIPPSRLEKALPRLMTGDLVVFVGRERWLFAKHTGTLVIDETGRRILRHANAARGVADQDFDQYVQRQRGRYAGLMFLRLLD